MKRYFTAAVLITLSFLNFRMNAQTFSVSGSVVDSTSGQPLIGTNVVVLNPQNSMKGGTASDIIGKFIIDKLAPGSYRLQISFIGYKIFSKSFEIRNKSVSFGIIRLSQSSVKIGEVKVVDKAPLAIQNKDTTEFLSNAVKTNQNATAEDLVTKMPGITVQSGKVQAQGEDVTKVLIDGKPYFGNDPNAVLKNIPAEIIEKIQVFDKQSEQSEFTGYDDGNNSKTINLVTKQRYRNGTFGKLAGGYGSIDRYKAAGSVNVFTPGQRMSFVGQMNNTNEQNFFSEDLLGVMSGGRGRRSSGIRNSSNGRGKGNDLSEFLIDNSDGITSAKAGGMNFITGSRKDFSLAASYFYNSTDNNSESRLDREYFLNAPDNRLYNETSLDNSVNINHRLNMQIDFRTDSLNSFTFIPTLTYQENNGSSASAGNTILSGQQLNVMRNDFSSSLSAVNAGSQLLWRHRFETRGRTFSVRFENAFSKSKGENNLNSESVYYDGSVESDTLNQKSNMYKNGFDLGTNLVYTEPVSEDGILQLSAGFSVEADKSDQKSYDDVLNDASYSYFDSTLSNTYNKKYFTDKYEAGYTVRKEGLVLSFGLAYNIARMKNEQTFPSVSYVNRSFHSFLPSFNFRYYVSKNRSFAFRYRTSNNSPSVDNLQNVLDNSNPLQLSIGNPDLSQDYRHFLSLRYTSTDYESMSTLFVLFSGTFIQNYIARNTIIADQAAINYNGILLNRGTQLRIPLNMNGQYTLRSLITYSLPVEFIKSVLSFNFNAGLVRRPSLINAITNYSNNNSYGAGLILNSNISEDVDFTVSSTTTYNHVLNSSQVSQNKEYVNSLSRIKLYWDVYAGWILQTDFTYSHQGGLGSEYDPNIYLWNLSLGKKMFAGDRGELRITFLDILNKNNNTERNARDTYIEDSVTNTLGRYFIVSFIYNVKSF